jgi:hypothetical protein
MTPSDRTTHPLLTVVIPVKNEERNLPACLAAIPRECAVVVVDSGSTDQTLDIARAAGAEVVQFTWNGRFPKKRNWMLETYSFQSPWVLFLDADERVSPTFMTEVWTALDRPGVAGYWINYSNHFLGKRLKHGVPQRKLALFRVGAGFYERIEEASWSALDMEVHEHPILDGPLSEISAPVEHLDFRGLHHFVARHNEYSSWEARRYLALKGDAVTWSNLTGRQRLKYQSLQAWWFAPAYFLFTYVARGGFLDGRQGLAYAFMKFVYFADVRLKVLEALDRSGNASDEANLNSPHSVQNR